MRQCIAFTSKFFIVEREPRFYCHKAGRGVAEGTSYDLYFGTIQVFLRSFCCYFKDNTEVNDELDGEELKMNE